MVAAEGVVAQDEAPQGDTPRSKTVQGVAGQEFPAQDVTQNVAGQTTAPGAKPNNCISRNSVSPFKDIADSAGSCRSGIRKTKFVQPWTTAMLLLSTRLPGSGSPGSSLRLELDQAEVNCHIGV